MNIINLMRRRPVASYFIVAFLISWGGTIAFGLGPFLSGMEPDLPDLMPMVMIMLSGPLLAGISMTYLTDGRDGLRDLFARMRKWNVGGRWYLSLLIFPALILAVQIPLSIWFNRGLAPIFNPIGIIAGLMAGLQEETGWMGFAYPKMRLRMSALGASIVLGLIHAVWHTAADFFGNFNTMGEDWLPYFVGFFSFVVALRIIIAWIYENTQSVFMTMLAHASSTGFLGILVPTANATQIWPVFYAVYTAALGLVAAFIIIRNRASMTEKPATPAKLSPSWQPGGN
ncbi:MAG: CPBP family intramembrane glutamic endopeptidase [Anaerolineales bacterium]|nr:CPBP family intramembrane glutamic endopeptidase [Anaerolineales bacterium]